ncbi:unnamed protein product [Victoria cruziana]
MLLRHHLPVLLCHPFPSTPITRQPLRLIIPPRLFLSLGTHAATPTTTTLPPPPSLLPSPLLSGVNGDEDDEDGAGAPIRFTLEKLFVPPDVQISADADASSYRILKGSNIVLSPYAKGSQVLQAEFVKSSTKHKDCPSDGRPEFALVGRSNVGKSSLLNSIVRRKQLALTSKKPGKTQCINHFVINNSWYLVDLPGYGYASAPQQARNNWDEFTRDYFLNRSSLVSVFLLVDASIPAKQVDLEYARWLGENKIPMTLIFTKCDKRKKRKNGGKRPEENVEDFQTLIAESFQQVPPWIMTSSVTNLGRDEILLHIAQLRNYWQKH